MLFISMRKYLPNHYLKYFLTLSVVYLVTCSEVSGQKKNSDTTIVRIKSYRDHWYIKLLSAQKDVSIGLYDKSTGITELEYKPNVGNYLGFGFFLFDLGIDITFRTPPSPELNSIYGNTKARDWQIHVYTRKLGANVIYQDYQGFYIANPQSYFPNWKLGDPYPLNENMRATVISGGLYYAFQPEKFSFPAVFNQTEMQLKSGGSFMLSGTITHSSLSDPESLIPVTDSNQFTGLNDLKSIKITSINVLPGYSYNLIIKKKFYLNFSLSLGGGYQIRSYSNDEYYSDNALAIANIGRVGGGYNSDRFFFGASGYMQSESVTIQNLHLSTSSNFFRFFIGYRFKEKGFLQRSIFELFDVFSDGKKSNKKGK